jgi:hypothetical protein
MSKKKEYRFTYRMEVYIEAESDEAAKSIYDDLDLVDIKKEQAFINSLILSADFVENVSAECVTDDYREI